MATLAHVFELIGGWIAPLIIFFVKRDSRFVSFHALQALLLQGAYFVLMMVLMAGIFAAVLAGVAFHQSAGQHGSLPLAFVIIFPIFWLGMMGWCFLFSWWPLFMGPRPGVVSGPIIL